MKDLKLFCLNQLKNKHRQTSHCIRLVCSALKCTKFFEHFIVHPPLLLRTMRLYAKLRISVVQWVSFQITMISSSTITIVLGRARDDFGPPYRITRKQRSNKENFGRNCKAAEMYFHTHRKLSFIMINFLFIL